MLIFAFLVDAPMTILYIVLNSLTVGILLGGDFFLTMFCFLGGLAAELRRQALQGALPGRHAPGRVHRPAGGQRLHHRRLLPHPEARGSRPGTGRDRPGPARRGGQRRAGLLAPARRRVVLRLRHRLQAPGAHQLGPAHLPPALRGGARLLPPFPRRRLAGRESGRGARAGHPAGQGRGPLPRHRQDQDARVLHREPDPGVRPPQGPDPVDEHAGHQEPRQGGRRARPQAQAAAPAPGDHRAASRQLARALLLRQGQAALRSGAAGRRRGVLPLPRAARPRSKEAGLVMLADAIEAASRSLKSPTKDNLKRVITDIINGTPPGRPARRLRLLAAGAPHRRRRLPDHPLRHLPPPHRVPGLRLQRPGAPEERRRARTRRKGP
ncbi:MAG: hypothetical protein MZW92_68855 [Comamonadaceae bacterium]|nr:hypothetical protein [Comamonadaceae bacterium]